MDDINSIGPSNAGGGEIAHRIAPGIVGVKLRNLGDGSLVPRKKAHKRLPMFGTAYAHIMLAWVRFLGGALYQSFAGIAIP